MIKGTPHLIKHMNKSGLLSIIMKEGGISRAKLAKESQISKATVSFIVDELIRENLIKETGEGVSTKRGGRKPIGLEFNESAAYIIGLNIGVKSSLCILSNLSGQIILEREFDTYYNKEINVLGNIIKEVKRMIESFDKKEKIIGMGVGVPGITDIENGNVLFAPKLNWVNLEIQKLLEESFNVKVWIDNDVNMGVLGEKWKGIGNKYNDFVFVCISGGIGSGIVINNKIHRGSSYTAGEIGYLVLSKEALKHGKYTFDQFGYFESVASVIAIEERYYLSCDEIFNKGAEGDKDCLQVIDEMTDYLSLGIANIMNILNPEALIIDGIPPQTRAQILAAIEKKITQLTPVKCALLVSELGKRSGIMGCIASVLVNTYGIEFY
ncbi:MAG: ROK family transcriptional regulator [Thermotaleaceae bacterium]